MRKIKKYYVKHRNLFLCGVLICFSNLFCPIAWGQTKLTLNGTVTDAKGDPLPGVSVAIKGTTLGTVTGLEGEFSIDTEKQPATLEISYIGYISQEIQASGRGTIRIILQEDTKLLDEVVVVAYGTQRKKDLTGAVSVVDTESMQKMLSPGIGQALQGLAAGVSVTTSGEPGSGADIRIRGIGSFSDVGPLYVIDGMIINGSQREFNMNDVESIQILKDASATALYGSRGANGVILITTKKGKDGPTKVDFNLTYGIQQISNRYDMMNSLEFLKVNRMAYENANLIWPGEPAQGQILTNTDWQDEFMKTGYTQDYNLNVSGGNQNGHYLLSFNYFDQEGVVMGPTHERFSVRSNSEAKRGIFTIGENMMVARSKTRPLQGSPFIDLARMPPVIPVYDSNEPDGYGIGNANYRTYGTNPIGLQETKDYTQTSYRIIGNAYLQIEPLRGLKAKTNVGVEYHNWYDRYIDNYKTIRYLGSASDYSNRLFERKGDFFTWMWENTVSYEKTIEKHRFDAMAGFTAQETKWENNEASVNDLVEGYWVLSSGKTAPAVGGSASDYAMTSFLGRINYDYAGKYLAQFNIRRDGSSRFGKNYRYGTFPSASLGWRISEESFFEPVKKAIDDLKIRVSYGKIGDQQALGDYDYATYVTTGEGGIFGTDQKYYSGMIQKGRANNDLRWETKTTLNLGIDFTAFDQRIYGSIEYYTSDSKDLLVQLPMSWTQGTDITPYTNIGKINNKGFEFMLGYKETQNAFKYDVSLNLTTLKNRVKYLGESYREAGISNINRTEVGRSMGDFFVLRTDGIFQSWDEVYAHTATIKNATTGLEETVLIQPNAAPGDIRYKDINNDGTINTDDREYVGSPLPDFEFGIRFSAEYKGFDFNLFLSGVTGNQIFNNSKFWLERMDETSNYPKGLSPWTSENPSTTTPRAFIATADKSTQNTLVYTDRWIEKGDYLRLKNIQIGYSVPKTILNKAKAIERLRIYAGVQNLFTITGYSGLDPEVSGGSVFSKGNDDGHFPPVRSFVAGLQLSF